MNKTLKVFFVSLLIAIIALAVVVPFLMQTSIKSDTSVPEQVVTAQTETPVRTKAIRQRARIAAIELSQYITTTTVEVINDELEVYGNTNLTEREFRNIVNNGEDKIYLHYRTDREIELSYDALLEIKAFGKSYSYEFFEEEATDQDGIYVGILGFLDMYSDVLTTDFYFLAHNAPAVLSNEIPATFIDCVVEKEYTIRFGDKGYLVYHIAASRYDANSTSLLLIVTINNSFVPGSVAMNNNESGYSKYNNYSGYVHMEVAQAYDDTEAAYYGRRWGNLPYKKDYWPLNNPSTVTIASSLQAGLSLGYSFTNGFSLDNINVGSNLSVGANISFGYSKSITRPEPSLSVQTNSSNSNICEWYYEYSVARSETNHLQTNYMFEIKNSDYGMLKGDFRLLLNYKFSVRKLKNLPIKDSTHQADLLVRAGRQPAIYAFSHGMI